MKKNFLLITLFFCCFQITFSQSGGQLDPSFGNQGIVKTNIGANFDYNSSARQAFIRPDGSIYVVLDAAIVSKRFANGSIDSSYGFDGYSRSVFLSDAYSATQDDGKIVIAGSVGNGLYGIVRINTNGIPDSAFGNNGAQTIGLNPRSLAIQSDGKIVVAGYSLDNNVTYFALARYTADGNPDNTFNGNGLVTTDIGFKLPPETEGGDSLEFHTAFANTVAIQADDKIVVGGYAYTGINNDFAVVRYNTDGSIDSTFDNDGKQITNINSSDDFGNSLAIQSDGKIILGGYTTVGPVNYFAVVRYKTNGGLDNSFNGDGKQTVNFGTTVQICNSVAIQSDGKIVLAGYIQNGTLNDFSLARFNTNGSLDNSFDNDGKLSTDLGSSDDYAASAAIQSDGKIVVAGHSFTYTPTKQSFAVTRYNIDGSLDNSFDGNGKLEGDYNQGSTDFNTMAIQPDGKIVTAGQSWNGTNYSFAVARYNNNGSLDSTFSDDGKKITDFEGGSYATSTAVQGDGKIVVAGNSDKKFTIARYNTDGSLDNTFSGDGKQTIAMGMSDICRSVALQQDGKIVIAGFSYTDTNLDSAYFAIARLNINGTPDNTFSDDGKQLTDFGSYKNFANAVAIQSDGKIVVAGHSNINTIDNFSLARYNNDGSLDASFSQDGKQNNTFGSDLYIIQSIAIQNDGSIVVAGNSESPLGNTSSLAIARYQTNGDLDNTFSDDGFQTTYLGAQSEDGKSVAINADGRIAVGGTNDNQAVVLLYNSNGSLDNTFSNDGIQITNIGVAGSLIQSVAFADNKLYAAGSAQFPGTLGIVARYLLESGPLPVSLLDFKGVLQNKSVLLQWKIATEKNVTKFVIERSADGNRFLPINSITGFGVSALTRDYSITDEKPLQHINFYRLKIVDVEGKFTYSNTIAVKINSGNKFQVFPNPAKDILFVLASGDNENATVDILDATGKKIKELKVFLNTNTSFSINVNSLSPGIYNLVLKKKQKAEVQTFIKK